LSKLLRADNLRYSEMTPEESRIDDDLYNYHLQFLVKKGFVKKEDKRYSLTEKGKVAVQHLDIKGNEQNYFKVGVLPYVVRILNGKKEILLEKRLRHPYFGDVNPSISGKVLFGEKITDAAKRKLEEETGLEAEFKPIGVTRKIRRDKNNQIIEDTFYHVCYGENPTGVLDERNVYGEHYWSDFNTALESQRKNVTASFLSEEVIKRVDSNRTEFFYFEEDITLPKY